MIEPDGEAANQQPDTESDELIEIIVDKQRTAVERTRASQALYHRHTHWIVRQVGKKIFDPDDVQDITQTVWMMVLQPDKLGTEYTVRNGNFRAYLRAPIRWAILKHIDKLPFTVGKDGKKASAHFTDISETLLEDSLDSSMLDQVIETIIKPNLHTVDIKSRNVYVINDYDTLFATAPTVDEIAAINRYQQNDAEALLSSAQSKPTDTQTDEEISVFVPLRYHTLVDPAALKQSSGRVLAKLIGISEAAFRKRLHTAKKQILEYVRQNLTLITRGAEHG